MNYSLIILLESAVGDVPVGCIRFLKSCRIHVRKVRMNMDYMFLALF